MYDSARELSGYAALCMACAENTIDEDARIRWLELAQKWKRLAEKAHGQQQQRQIQPTKNEF